MGLIIVITGSVINLSASFFLLPLVPPHLIKNSAEITTLHIILEHFDWSQLSYLLIMEVLFSIPELYCIF